MKVPEIVHRSSHSAQSLGCVLGLGFEGVHMSLSTTMCLSVCIWSHVALKLFLSIRGVKSV